MTWRCAGCGGSRAVIDLSGDEPVRVGCINCNWNLFVGEGWCVAPRKGYGTPFGRCSREAVLNGMCWQHAEKEGFWDQVAAAFRSPYPTGALPEAVREAFSRAFVAAGLLRQDEASDRARIDRLIQRSDELAEARQKKAAASVVYFVRRENLVKIGTTTNLQKRLRDIGRGSCMPDGMSVGPVELLATTPGDRDLEHRLHEQFHAHRVGRTEWFTPAPPVLRLVARFQRRAESAPAA